MHRNGGYKGGRREGPWVFYHLNKQIKSQGAYKNGRREGPWEEYDRDGTKDEDLSGSYRDDVKVSD